MADPTPPTSPPPPSPSPSPSPLPGWPQAGMLGGRVHLTRLLARGWWMFILRGVVGILFAILAFVFPPAALSVLLAFLGAWLLIDGITTLGLASSGHAAKPGAWLWLDGIVSILCAVLLWVMPVGAALGLVMVVGIWSIIGGVLRLVQAFRMGNVLVGLLGALSVFFGAWLLAYPGPGLLALLWVLGLEALFGGVLMLGIGWRLRRIAHDPHAPGHH